MNVANIFDEGFSPNPREKRRTEKQGLSKLFPLIVFIVRQFQATQALGFHLTQQEDQLYIKSLGFLMPTLVLYFPVFPLLTVFCTPKAFI